MFSCMAWDTERTRRLLLEAATREFCEVGPDGARVDRIARRAGVNKERIYSYFGSKDRLFDAVVERELANVVVDAPLVGTGPDAVGGYAGVLFDRAHERPVLPRLMAWEGLLRGREIAQLHVRQRHCREKVTALRGALPGVSEGAAAQLLLSIVSLTNGWAVFPQLGRLFVGEGEESRVRRRAAVVVAASALAAEAVDAAGSRQR